MSESTQPQKRRRTCELALNRSQKTHRTDNSAGRKEFDGLRRCLTDLRRGHSRDGKQGGDHAIRAGNITHDAGIAINQHTEKVANTTDTSSGTQRVTVGAMSVQATLVMGTDGSTSFLGNSDGVTTPADRAQFLVSRRKSDVIMIGGNTARHERYRRTPVPLVVLSHSYPAVIGENPKAHWWNLSPLEAVRKAEKEFGPAIFVEAGVSMIGQLLSVGLISQLNLSVTPMSGGENRADLTELLSYFKVVEHHEKDATIFYSCTQPI